MTNENFGPTDQFRINANNEYELRYWAEDFGCTVSQLQKAIRVAGVMISDIVRYLRARKI